jgi:hypothetical protein
MDAVDEAIDKLLADRRMYQAECQTLRHELDGWKREAIEQSKLLAVSLNRIEELLTENERWRALADKYQSALHEATYGEVRLTRTIQLQ